MRRALLCEIFVQTCVQNTWKEKTECTRDDNINVDDNIKVNDNINVNRNEIINKMYTSIQSNRNSII